jgi:hypothetical protein
MIKLPKATARNALAILQFFAFGAIIVTNRNIGTANVALHVVTNLSTRTGVHWIDGAQRTLIDRDRTIQPGQRILIDVLYTLADIVTTFREIRNNLDGNISRSVVHEIACCRASIIIELPSATCSLKLAFLECLAVGAKTVTIRNISTTHVAVHFLTNLSTRQCIDWIYRTPTAPSRISTIYRGQPIVIGVQHLLAHIFTLLREIRKGGIWCVINIWIILRFVVHEVAGCRTAILVELPKVT